MLVIFTVYSFTVTHCQGSMYYHIAPSVNDSCSAEYTCLTLTQFTANLNIYLAWNTTLMFLPGDHSLGESDFSVTDDPVSLNLKSKSAKVHCDLFGGFVFQNISTIHVSGIEFLECALFFSSVDHIVIEDTVFTGQVVLETIVEFYKCYTVIMSSCFTFATGISATRSNLTIILTIV